MLFSQSFSLFLLFKPKIFKTEAGDLNTLAKQAHLIDIGIELMPLVFVFKKKLYKA